MIRCHLIYLLEIFVESVSVLREWVLVINGKIVTPPLNAYPLIRYESGVCLFQINTPRPEPMESLF